jgi:hypothetical protein
MEHNPNIPISQAGPGLNLNSDMHQALDQSSFKAQTIQKG